MGEEADKVMEGPVFADDLKELCERLFGFRVLDAAPLPRGWLNLKWKLATDQTHYVFKKYHSNRFKEPSVLRRALEQQQRLHKSGIPCPKLLAHEGNILHSTRSAEPFILMEYREGDLLAPGMFNDRQMYHLGQLTGRMHRLLNDALPALDSGPVFMPPSREERLAHWDRVKKKAEEEGQADLLPAIELTYKTTANLDLESLGACQAGWAHRDLWADNLLIRGDRIAAILDFDRLHYDYPELDVARAILSCAYRDGELQIVPTVAFLRGYREEREFPQGSLVRTLRLLWYMESEWWIRVAPEEPVPKRFAEEMLWLARHERELDEKLGFL